MNSYQLISLEIATVLLGLGILLADLWIAPAKRRMLGFIAAAGVAVIFAASFSPAFPDFGTAFGKMYVFDGLSLFFKRFFLAAAFIVLLLAIDFADRIAVGISEFYSLILFALAGMMFAASSNDFTLMFAALELITITFYVLTSFQRNKLQSLEAGVKYLILGALSTGFTVFGIALVSGIAGTTNFIELSAKLKDISGDPIFLIGLLLLTTGLGFKIAAFPFHVWAPDVYQGSPAPVTAFLAVGSKAAGIVLLMRVLFVAVPEVAKSWSGLLAFISGATILYGSLCAIPQRSLKRLLGYSSIANAGFLMLGIAAVNKDGVTAVLVYLVGYLFAVLAAFTVISIITRNAESDDISVLAGLSKRSPMLAAALTFSMVSLAGIPPLAGFFGKFLLLKAVIKAGAVSGAHFVLLAVAVVAVVVSLYYYFGVIRAIFWSKDVSDHSPIPVPRALAFTLAVCMAGMFLLGVFPRILVDVDAESLNSAVGVFARLL